MPINSRKDLISVINSFKNGNPAEIVSNMVQEVANQGNPVMKNLAGLIQKGDTDQIETVVRNIAKEQGVDYDKEFKAFKQMFRL